MSKLSESCEVNPELEPIVQDCFQHIRTIRKNGWHKTTAGEIFPDLATAKTLSAWTAVLAATGDDKVIITPIMVYNTVITPTEPITNGTPGGTDTAQGVAEVNGQSVPHVSQSITATDAPTTEIFGNLFPVSRKEGVSFFYLDPDNNQIFAQLNSNGSISGIESQKTTLHFSTRSVDNIASNFNTLQYDLFNDWDSKLIAIPCEFSVRDLANVIP